MGGFGSGMWFRYDKKTCIEEVKRIDIRFLKKIGVLNKFCSGQLSWSAGGRPSGTINYHATPEDLELKFNFRRGSYEQWQPIKQRIYFSTTDCNYGGKRYWLICPNCHRRVGILCGLDRLFLCRHCYKIPYGAQQESVLDRVLRRKHKIGERIFDDYENGFGWRKKKGMHQKTFNRFYAEYRRLEYQSLLATETMLEKMNYRLNE